MCMLPVGEGAKRNIGYQAFLPNYSTMDEIIKHSQSKAHNGAQITKICKNHYNTQ
ncbi:hypothetical protein HAL07_07200 [Helicobacter ailurogastricus]|uniref:Uncharacterized protein n=1 Tax=Helicobacter ailurogastricus TaxID=1578720 RepID=A0A0K2Y2P0_9HELI|nr:hypothetical protein HAL07_07200 [Helicobacter ailurogastricus]